MFLAGMQALALDVVYPHKTIVTIQSPSTFFVGSTNPSVPLKINGQTAAVHKSGGFAYTVKLSTGKNVFTLESGDKKLVYIIDRPMSVAQTKPAVFSPYPQAVSVLTTDNTALRSTPVNADINRIAHYPKNIPLTIDGEQGEFFRVKLSETEKAWVHKGDCRAADDFPQPAALKKQEQTDNNDFYIFNFEFDRKIPYVINENQVTFYNVSGLDTYTFTAPVKQKFIGYGGSFHGNKFVLKIRKCPKINKLKDVKVAIDAGHGGSESGATGCFRDLEKDINLAIAKYLETELKNRGADVIMTRHGDAYLRLHERVIIANEKDAMVFVSIHANSLPDTADPNANRGTSVYYYYDQAKPLAQSILNAMTDQLGLPNNGVRQASFAVVRNTEAPSVLVETAYMINPIDNELLRDRDFQQFAAKAIADGITNYIMTICK
jgi:N-acetylmuramoyl-L-alanine amidase